VELLGGLQPGGVAVLVAPAGYGVTSLLAMVAEASAESVVWVSGKAHGGTAASLWGQLAERMLAVGVAAPELLANVGTDPDAVRRGVAELMAAAWHGPEVLLVLDDLPRDEVVDAMVQHVLDAVPLSMRVLVSTTSAPRLDLSGLSGSGRLVLLEGTDLALRPEESDEYVRMVAPDLPPPRRTSLVGLADGWIAALSASTSAIRSDPSADPAAWLLGPGLELLFGRGLQALDPLDRDLLVVCSVLDQLSPEACDAMLGRSDSAERLVALRERLVVRRVPGPGPVRYETHPLLREFLGRKLAERGRGAQSRAHEVAGLWLAAQGDAELAISHLLECGRIERAREVLAAHVKDLLDSGRSERVRTWYRRAPELAVPDHQMLLLGAAWSELLGGNVAAAGPHLLELEAAVARLVQAAAETPGSSDPAGTGTEWLRVEVLWLRSYLEAWTGQTRRGAEHLRRVRESYGEDWSRMAHQASAFHEVRLDLWHGDRQAARRKLLQLAGRPGTVHFYHRVALPSLGALVAADEGRAHRACFLADSALDALAASGWLGAADHCDARLARARGLADLGESALAESEAAAVQQTASEVQHVPYLVLGTLARARALAAGRRPAAAHEQLESARLVLSRHGARGPLAGVIDHVEADVAIMAGDRARARRAVERLSAGRGRDLLAVRVLAMGGLLAEADVVRTVRQARPESPREVVDARLLMAALTAPTRRSEATMHLRAAATLAHEHGMRLALRGRSEELLVLAEQVATAGVDPAVAALVESLHRRADPDGRAAPALSAGERQLLERLALFPRNRELAEDLGISPNTLKTRLRRLYAKLGVHDRASALRAAAPGF
jgi:LuxR family maltose regulon positive regulatory protein